MMSMLILSAIGDISDKLVYEAMDQGNPKPRLVFRRRRSFVFVAAAVALFLLCGFAAYQAGLFDPWFQKPSISPIETVQSAIENQTNKEYTHDVQLREVVIDERATERAKRMYIGSELAKANGWSDDYLENNMIVVYAEYYVEYDHEKTFLEDGEIKEFFILLRDEGTNKWSIWDNTTSGDPFQ